MKEKIVYILKITGIVLLVTALLGYSVFALVMSDKWHKDVICRDVEINILDKDIYSFVDESDVFLFIKSKDLNPIGKSVDYNDMDKLEKCVQKINVIRTAECYLDNFGVVRISVTQRIPVYRVISAKGSYYIDSDRRVMPISKNFTTMLPLVTGYVTQEDAKGKIYDFIENLEKDEFWKNHIGQIDIRKNGNVEIITKIGAKSLILNDISDYAVKFKQMEALYSQYPAHLWSGKYSQVDLRYNNIIFCRKVTQK
ncbi:MAG: cell division protein FtsQ/DivIB [Paludibacteraceae bacterium]|nr:cell division protein FtsQ/DivIB [Paludibacteraceae bacterium]